MAARATAGDFLLTAAGQLRLARATPMPPAAGADGADIARAIGHLTSVLDRYLGDIGPASELRFGDAPALTGWPRTALLARESLAKASQTLGYSRIHHAYPPPPGRHLAAASLTAATRSLTAARDLLYTHFTPERGYASEWAPILASHIGDHARASEVSWWARHLAPVATSLAEAPGRHSARAAQIRSHLETAAHSLWHTATTLDTALTRDPHREEGRTVLYSVPINSMPEERIPTGQPTLTEICDGILTSAERLRQTTWRASPAKSPAISSTSQRHTASLAVVISHNCAAALHQLATRARQFGYPQLATHLAAAAAAASGTQARWLDTARIWGSQVVTDTRQPLTPTARETTNLALWTHTLAYSDPPRAPGHWPHHETRQLAPTPATLQQVITATHHTGETLSRLAEAEYQRAREIANAGRLYVRTRILPDTLDIPYRYGPAQREHIDTLLAAHHTTQRASAQLAHTIGATPGTTAMPSQILAHATSATARQEPRTASPGYQPAAVTLIGPQRAAAGGRGPIGEMTARGAVHADQPEMEAGE